MSLPSHIPQQSYPVAWFFVLVVVSFYVVMAIFFRWQRRHRVAVTRYEPPTGVSPAIAAYLWQNGRCERAFAAALVSLAAKGYIRLELQKNSYTLLRLRKGGPEVPPEEARLLELLFPFPFDNYAFSSADCALLYSAYRRFGKAVDTIADPELITPHSLLWIFAISISAMIPLYVLILVPRRTKPAPATP